MNIAQAFMSASRPDVITPQLLLSGQELERDISKLQELGVTHILQIGCEPSHPRAFKYFSLPVTDWLFSAILQYFDAAFAFIDEAHAAGGKVLLHCQLGVSRSASFAAGYLMRTQQLTAAAALAKVHAARPCIAPNKGFICQLLEYEQMRYDVTNWPGWDGDRWRGHPLTDATKALWAELQPKRKTPAGEQQAAVAQDAKGAEACGTAAADANSTADPCSQSGATAAAETERPASVEQPPAKAAASSGTDASSASATAAATEAAEVAAAALPVVT